MSGHLKIQFLEVIIFKNESQFKSSLLPLYYLSETEVTLIRLFPMHF